VRVRGTIEGVEGGVYIVKARDDSILKLTLATTVHVAASVKSRLSDIKPGSYIVVAALPQDDGSQRTGGAHLSRDHARPGRGTIPVEPAAKEGLPRRIKCVSYCRCKRPSGAGLARPDHA
jgi:hypothetical protein